MNEVKAIVEASAAANSRGERCALHSIREVCDTRLHVIGVIGDSMAPELEDGWKVLVDTERVQPAEGALVAVYIKDEGGVLGRWHVEDGKPMLRKANREYSPIFLGAPDEWTLWGTVSALAGRYCAHDGQEDESEGVVDHGRTEDNLRLIAREMPEIRQRPR